jgi:transcriptional regulator
MNKIIERLSGNKKQITMEEYSAVERRIQENIEKKRNARKFSF